MHVNQVLNSVCGYEAAEVTHVQAVIPAIILCRANIIKVADEECI
jgi:hypothetical protein